MLDRYINCASSSDNLGFGGCHYNGTCLNVSEPAQTYDTTFVGFEQGGGGNFTHILSDCIVLSLKFGGRRVSG